MDKDIFLPGDFDTSMKEPLSEVTSSKNINNPVVLGKISSPYGIRGWLKINSYTDKKENILFYQPWIIHLNNEYHEIELEDWKTGQSSFIIKIKGSNTRDESTKFSNTTIIGDSSLFPHLDDGEYYWTELIGCHVITKEGCNVGTVLELLSTGANDVLVVHSSLIKNKKKLLIPFINQEVIKKIDIFSRYIEITWEKNFFI
ncbi:MAG: ribosome maturation factor RimM [Candidatus Dasytiphilus stammeri]